MEKLKPTQILVNQRGKVINLLAAENLGLMKELVTDLRNRRIKHGDSWGLGRKNSRKLGAAKGLWKKRHGIDLMDLYESFKRAYRPQAMRLIPYRTDGETLRVTESSFIVQDLDLGTITEYSSDLDEVTLEPETQQTLELMEQAL